MMTNPLTTLQLFDMDGTIIDSTPAIVKYWTRIGSQINVSPAKILATSHGRRSIDVLSILAPELANWSFVCEAEGRVPIDFHDEAIELPGSRALLQSLEDAGAPWAIVTSGTTPLVQGWIKVLGLAQPKHLVTAEQVAKGKPDPACYLLGRERLGVTSGETLVLEDAPAGIRAGKAAGFNVVGLATSHRIEELIEAGADWVVKDLDSLRLTKWNGETRECEIEIRNALVR